MLIRSPHVTYCSFGRCDQFFLVIILVPIEANLSWLFRRCGNFRCAQGCLGAMRTETCVLWLCLITSLEALFFFGLLFSRVWVFSSILMLFMSFSQGLITVLLLAFQKIRSSWCRSRSLGFIFTILIFEFFHQSRKTWIFNGLLVFFLIFHFQLGQLNTAYLRKYFTNGLRHGVPKAAGSPRILV